MMPSQSAQQALQLLRLLFSVSVCVALAAAARSTAAKSQSFGPDSAGGHIRAVGLTRMRSSVMSIKGLSVFSLVYSTVSFA